MSTAEKREKRDRALHKLGNQIKVLSRTATTKQKPVINEIATLFATL